MSEVVKVQFRRGVASEWSDSNPTLHLAEISLDLTNSKIRIGDGLHAWADLPNLLTREVSHPFFLVG